MVTVKYVAAKKQWCVTFTGGHVEESGMELYFIELSQALYYVWQMEGRLTEVGK